MNQRASVSNQPRQVNLYVCVLDPDSVFSRRKIYTGSSITESRLEGGCIGRN
jgi:hypothetical protein